MNKLVVNAAIDRQQRSNPLTDEQKEKNREAVRRYRQKHKDAIAARRKANSDKRQAEAKAYYQANRELILERNRKNYESNKDAKLQKQKAFRDANKDLISERQRGYRISNGESIRSSERRSKKCWREQNPHLVAELSARHRAHLSRSLWGDRLLIAEAYELAKLRTKMTGIRWEVDHIVPLNSGLVCGLHVEDNLRVIPMVVNRTKSNKFWPGHPEVSLSQKIQSF